MQWVWRGGDPVAGSPPDPRRAALGVFTTVGCDLGDPLLWPQHRQRLVRDLAALDPEAHAVIPERSQLARLLREAGLMGPARLRVVVWRGEHRWLTGGHAAPLDQAGPGLPPLALEQIFAAGVPPLAGHKTLARLPWELAAREAQRRGGDDALLVDAQGRVLETSTANIWTVRGREVITPPAPEYCLPGVMRHWLLQNLSLAGLEPKVRELPLGELLEAEEVWISNAVIGLRRVARVGSRRWDCWPRFTQLARLPLPAPGWRRSTPHAPHAPDDPRRVGRGERRP